VRLLGERYTVKLAGAETGGAFALVENVVPPGAAGPPPHRHHRTDETFYVLSGELEYTADGATVRAGAGSVVRVPRGVLHTYRNAGAGPATQLVAIAPAGFEAFFLEAGEAPDAPEAGPPDIGRLLEIGRRHDLEVPPPPGP
jgi:mannose-6-phosphate isomerase-like protein (cupin superfamily)